MLNTLLLGLRPGIVKTKCIALHLSTVFNDALHGADTEKQSLSFSLNGLKARIGAQSLISLSL